MGCTNSKQIKPNLNEQEKVADSGNGLVKEPDGQEKARDKGVSKAYRRELDPKERKALKDELLI